MPPCRHYQTVEELLADARHLVSSDDFKSHLSPQKRRGLLLAVRDQAQSYLDYSYPAMSSQHALLDRGEPGLLGDPSLPSLQHSQDLGGGRFRRNNNNTLLIGHGGSYDPLPQSRGSAAHLRKGSVHGYGGRSLLS